MPNRFLMSKRRKMADLQIELRETDRELGQLNRDLARELIVLAEESSETEPLIQALDALNSAQRYYSFGDAPVEHADLLQSIADLLLRIGRETEDREALLSARNAYRGAITLASLLSDDRMRDDLRANYKLTQLLLGDGPDRVGVFKVA